MTGAEWVVFTALGGLSVMDVRMKKIPMLPVIFLAVPALIYHVCCGKPLPELAFGIIPGMILLVLAWMTKESIGYGDGAVLVVLGMFCGIKRTVALLGMAFFLAALLATVLLVIKRAGRKTELPFLPCLCAGYLLCLLW